MFDFSKGQCFWSWLLRKNKNDASVNVVALQASSLAFREKSDVVCSLSAGCHWDKGD